MAALRDRETASSGSPESSGSLPFTGFAALLLALVGTATLLAGAKLRGSAPARR